MLVDMVVAVGNVEAAGCLTVNAVHSSKKVVVSEGVAAETGSYSKVFRSKIVQTRSEGCSIAKAHVPFVEAHSLLLVLHSPLKTASVDSVISRRSGVCC